MIANRTEAGKPDASHTPPTPAQVFAAECRKSEGRKSSRLRALEAMVRAAGPRPIGDAITFAMFEIVAATAYAALNKPKDREGIERYELVLTHLANIFSGGKS